MEVTNKAKDVAIDKQVHIDYFAQPIYNPKNLEISCYEILSKVYQNKNDISHRGGFFIPNNNHISKYVILNQIDYFLKIKLNKPFFIKMALSSLEDNNFLEEIHRRSSKYLSIEISDFDCSLSDSITEKIKRLYNNGNGIKFSLDNYHHQYRNANLSLGIIKWEYIKIDKSFLYYNLENTMKIRSLIFILSAFCNKGVIFDGVETHFTLDVLKQHDVLAQGFYPYPPKKYH